MLNRRRLLIGGVAAVGAAAVEPARRLLFTSGSTPAAGAEPGSSATTTATAVARQQPQFTSAWLPGLAADGPPFNVALSTATVAQGGALRVRTSLGQSGTATLFGREYGLTAAPAGGLEAYVPIGINDAPGPTSVAVAVTNGDIAEAASLPLRVEATQWIVEYLEIPPAPPGEDDPLDPVAIQQENARLAATYGAVSPGRSWVEPWILPMAGDLTAFFGDQRSINGGPVGGHHSGVDIATPFGEIPGAPIHAANHGRVVLSDRLIVRGNMVIIDHGSGVFSGYAHMEERLVAEGDTVTQGMQIGIEGATGLVTGAHLHWEVSVGGILVDGLRWVNGSQGF